MRNWKRILAALLALAMLFSLVAISEEALAPVEIGEPPAEEPAQQEPVDEELRMEEAEQEEPIEEGLVEEPAVEESPVEEPATEEAAELPEQELDGEAAESEGAAGEADEEAMVSKAVEAEVFGAERGVFDVKVLKREGNTANSAKLEQVLCDELELGRFDGSEIRYIGFADYDGDGKGEAFAYVRHTPKEKPEMTIIRIYFVTEKGVEKLYPQSIEDASEFGGAPPFKLSGEFQIWDLGNRCLFYAEIYNTILDKGMIWAVEKGKTSNITDQFPDAEVKHLSGNVFLCTFKVQDFGSKYVPKYFYYYKDKKIKEYGGKYITKKQFLEYAGSQKIIREAASKGYTLEDIIYRSCGFIHLTFTKTDANGIRTSWFYTVSYDDTSVKRYDEGEGIYKRQNTKNATAPKSFKHPKGITKIELSAPNSTINLGGKLQLTTTLTPAIADTTLTWKSTKPKIAEVDANGLVTAKSEGTAKISVTSGNEKSKSITIKVVDPYKPTGVKLNQTGTVELDMRNTLTLRATLEPSTAQSELSWKSSNKKIATVENGVVKPLKEGKVKITVTTAKKNAKGKKMSASVTLKVVNANRPTGIALENQTKITISVGQSKQLIPTLKPAAAVTGLTWKTSNKKYVTVDQQGVIKGIKKGKATISVTTYNGKTAKCVVTVKESTGPSYSPPVDPYEPSHPNPGPTPVPPSGHNPPDVTAPPELGPTTGHNPSNVTAAPPAVDPEKW